MDKPATATASTILVPTLANVSLADLPAAQGPDLEAATARVLAKAAEPGLAISGYSGASALSRDPSFREEPTAG